MQQTAIQKSRILRRWVYTLLALSVFYVAPKLYAYWTGAVDMETYKAANAALKDIGLEFEEKYEYDHFWSDHRRTPEGERAAVYLTVNPLAEQDSRVPADLGTKDFFHALEALDRLPPLDAIIVPKYGNLEEPRAREVAVFLFDKVAEKHRGVKVLHLTGYEFAEIGPHQGSLDWYFPELESLKIETNILGDRILELFAECRKLRVIEVGPPAEGTPAITGAGIGSLPNAIERLELTGAKISGKNLASLKRRPVLRDVSFNRCPFTDDGIACLGVIADSLESVYFENCEISDAGLNSLAGIPFPRLKGITFKETRVTKEAAEALNNSRPYGVNVLD